MTTPRHLPAGTVEFPTDLQIVVTREFAAPLPLVFDVFTQAEHMRHTVAPYGEQVTLCEVDLRVGGDYHYVFLTPEGKEMSFRGTFRAIDPPTRTEQTWIYDGWPDVEAVESIDLRETDGGTHLTWTITFADEAGRKHMGYDMHGLQANFDNVAAYLQTLTG